MMLIDFEDSFLFYQNRTKKIAQRFYSKINYSFEQIKKNPEIYPISDYNIRKYIVKGFPFVIYYTINLFQIRIIAIFHNSRNPEIWKDRENNL
jgi:plasmid stabilization system protein ParE